MSACRSCGMEILWTRTERGKKMPLDAAPICDAIAETHGLYVLRETDHQDGPLALAAWGLEGTEPHYASHFNTCTHKQSDTTGFHVKHNHAICHMADRPHDDPTGCPTCHATNPSDTSRCYYLALFDAGRNTA